MYKCRICGGTWTEIPSDSIEIASKRRGALYQFGGTVHDLRQHKPTSAEQHRHKHKKNPRPDCKFWNPLLAAEQASFQEAPEPNPPVEQPPLVQAPVPEPQIMVEEVKPVVAEFERELTTALAVAFRRRKQIQN